MAYEEIARASRRKPLLDPDSAGVEVSLGVAEVERILPHRPPVRYVDGISRVDLPNQGLVGFRDVAADDPVFTGHFPDVPLYPGTYQLESIGQMGVCLAWFLRHETTEVPADAQPSAVRALKIHHAQFVRPVPPGVRATMVVKLLEQDDFGAVVAGQFIVDGKITSFSVGELYFPN